MKTLSLWQPHALAIGIGLKPWETRGWSTDYRGPIAIHAAKRSWSDVGPWHTAARQILQEYVAKHGSVPWHFGAVVCTADMVSCIRTSELRGAIPAEHEFWGDFTDGEEGKGRFAFKLENVKMLAQPFYVRGMQGWFDVDLGAEERVAAAGPMQFGLFDMFSATPAPIASAAPEIEQIATLFDDQEQACAELFPAVDPEEPVMRSTRDQEKACELSRQFAQACEAAGFQYRGYGDQGSERVYAYSRPGAPETVFEMALSAWDRTAESLRAAAAPKCNPESGRGPMVSSSDDPMERRAAYLHAARWWRAEAQMNGKGRDSEEHWYAENQELLAADIERRPNYYRNKPASVTDWNWFQAGKAI